MNDGLHGKVKDVNICAPQYSWILICSWKVPWKWLVWMTIYECQLVRYTMDINNKLKIKKSGFIYELFYVYNTWITIICLTIFSDRLSLNWYYENDHNFHIINSLRNHGDGELSYITIIY